MKRAIQRIVQDKLAVKILDGTVLHGDLRHAGRTEEGELTFEVEDEAEAEREMETGYVAGSCRLHSFCRFVDDLARFLAKSKMSGLKTAKAMCFPIAMLSKICGFIPQIIDPSMWKLQQNLVCQNSVTGKSLTIEDEVRVLSYCFGEMGIRINSASPGPIS